jgi:eukaryotic-like serine/threonine-protein kinase
MPLPPGTKLGPYEIIELIGAGGMGEVYRAADTRLDREVAIKVSAEAFSERFEREARVIASLNHPNICTLFDVGPNYLVMELIGGPTLADRINEGAIPLDEALPLARQIAEALEAAHEKGVVHRDLKPGNVKITNGGVVKVLDFGLAKIVGEAPTPSGSSPLTVTIGSTQAGMIMGTASYMSPEQAKGKPVDKRADIWAFGVVLHEMLTGQKLFERESLSETLAGVLTEAPDLKLVPPQVRPLLQRCLEKDPKKRLRDIGDAMALLESAPEPVASAAAAQPPPPQRREWLWPAVAALFLMATLALSLIHFRETPPPARLMQFTIPAPEKNGITTALFAVSPNGRYLAFEARGADGIGRLWLRDLEETEAKPLPGTEHFGEVPFWSPDSRFVAFDTSDVSGRKLKKIDVAGGPPQVICDLLPGANSALWGGSWNRDGIILFASDRGVMQVSAAGGVPSPVTSLNPSWNERLHLSPSFLPDGKRFLYVRLSSNANAEKTGLYEGSLDAKPEQQSSRLLLPGITQLYVPSSDPARGQVLFVRDGSLLAQAFDDRRGELSGSPVAVAEHVGEAGGGAWGRFSASSNGVLVYQTEDIPNVQLAWYDRNGKVLGTVGEPARYERMVLSHDGTKAALARVDPQTGNRDIWLVDLAQGTSTRFTFDIFSTSPIFSPDGSRVAFLSSRNRVLGLYEKAANGAGSEDVLVKSIQAGTLSDWTADGRFLIYGGGSPFNTWVLPLNGDRKPFPFARTQFSEISAHLSPDGRFIGYYSNESGRNEVYVKPFTPEPDAGSSAAKWLVSRNGSAGMVHWRKDGKELYYLGMDGNVMAVDVTTTPAFHAGVPKTLFAVPPAFMRLSATPGILGDVSPDGQRFLFALPPEKNGRDEFSVILNWTEKLKR